MKTLPINNSTFHNNFKGLWKHGDTIALYEDRNHIIYETTDYYCPFLNEPEQKIKEALNNHRCSYSFGEAEDLMIEEFKTYAEKYKRLPFTEKEYYAYKEFFGRIMPEAIKEVEDGLKAFGLDKYLNRGFVYNIKKFIHNLIKK